MNRTKKHDVVSLIARACTEIKMNSPRASLDVFIFVRHPFDDRAEV